MLLAYYGLLITLIIIVVLIIILFMSDGADSTAVQDTMLVGLAITAAIATIGFIGASLKTGDVYRAEYDELIQNIDKNKTRVIKEDDKITDIYITVNGEEHHFKIKEKTTDE